MSDRLNTTEASAGEISRLTAALADRDRVIADLTAANAALAAELAQMTQNARNAIWTDSEECKVLAADNARLIDGLVRMKDDRTGFRHPVHFRRFIVGMLGGDALKGDSHE